MTMGLIEKSPQEECTTDLTPRRLQKFKVRPGDKVKWSNVSSAKEVQTGEATVDEHGLITIKSLKITKDKNRIKITK
jgi:hypothetical protein